MDEYSLKNKEESYQLGNKTKKDNIYLNKPVIENKIDKKEKFDLEAAIKDGCSIDESGICTCGAGW